MKRVRFLYIRDEKKFPIGCIAYIRERGVDDSNDQIVFNYSIYNPNERFDKKTARIWAAGMLATDPMVHTATGDGYHVNNLLHDVCLKIEADGRPKTTLARQRLVNALQVTKMNLLKSIWEKSETLSNAMEEALFKKT